MRTSFARWLGHYERYKGKRLPEQTLRLTNTMFLVFTFWNMIRAFFALKFVDLPDAALLPLGFAAVLIGILLAFLILLRSSCQEHLAVIPFAAAAFALMNERDTAFRLILIPILALATLALVRLIISSSNTINRM